MKTPTRVRSGICPVRSGFKFFFECPVRFRSVNPQPVRHVLQTIHQFQYHPKFMKTPTRVRSGICPVRSGFKTFFECPVRTGPVPVGLKNPCPVVYWGLGPDSTSSCQVMTTVHTPFTNVKGGLEHNKHRECAIECLTSSMEFYRAL
eukprot:sb/3473776/